MKNNQNQRRYNKPYKVQKSRDLVSNDAEQEISKLKYNTDLSKAIDITTIDVSDSKKLFEIRKTSLELAIGWFKNHPEEALKGNIEPEDIVDLAMFFESYFQNINPSK